MLHKHDDVRRAGLGPGGPPHLGAAGRTNDEVKAAPDRLWRSDLPAAEAAVAVGDARPPGPPRPSWPRSAELGGEGRGRSSAARYASPTSTRCCSRAGTASRR